MGLKILQCSVTDDSSVVHQYADCGVTREFGGHSDAGVIVGYISRGELKIKSLASLNAQPLRGSIGIARVMVGNHFEPGRRQTPANCSTQTTCAVLIVLT